MVSLKKFMDKTYRIIALNNLTNDFYLKLSITKKNVSQSVYLSLLNSHAECCLAPRPRRA